MTHLKVKLEGSIFDVQSALTILLTHKAVTYLGIAKTPPEGDLPTSHSVEIEIKVDSTQFFPNKPDETN